MHRRRRTRSSSPPRLDRARGAGLRALVVDASTDEHLARIAAQRHLAVPPLLVGSGGLAAQLLGGTARAAEVRGYGVPRVLTVVGSHSTVAQAQVDALLAAGARPIHPADPAAPSSGDVVLTPDPAQPLEPARAAAIAAALGALAAEMARGFDALVLTGGETARAVLDALQVRMLDVVRELEPGVVLSRAPGLPFLLVTKAGAFGDAGSLDRIRTLLHAPS